MNRITHISVEPNFAAWRRAARALLLRGIAPENVEWIEGGSAAQTPHLAEIETEFSAATSAEFLAASSGSERSVSSERSGKSATSPSPAAAIPRELLARLKTAACFRAPDRWALLYRVLWRWTHGERHVINPADADGALLAQRIDSVERETVGLLTLTLFRRRDPSMGPPEFVGWYEPRNDLLERAAALFAERMGESTWMFASPHGAAFWNGLLLRNPRAAAEEQEGTENPQQAPAAGAMAGEAVTSEAAEALWLAYYANAVSHEPVPMPLRYWRTPPAGPPLPAPLARERCRLGAQRASVQVPEKPPVEHSALTPPFREPTGSLATCRRCALWRNAKQAVAGVGPADSKASIMVVGEQPGEYENQHGEPFAGPAGQLLDTVFARAGLERAGLYLTYAIKHYKWETLDHHRVHRTPAPREVEACQYWLEKELTQVAPHVVVTLGATALKALTGAHVNLSEYLGQTIAHGGRLIVPTWHPAYALRTTHELLREDIVAGIVSAFRRAAALTMETTCAQSQQREAADVSNK